jgi:hypothetical protein
MVMSVIGAVPIGAQEHVADADALRQVISERNAADQADRDVVSRVLAREDVKQVARQLGVDVKDAASAVATLSGDELAELARAAQAVENEAVGGQRVIVISVTTLLLIIILIVLVAK